MDKEVLISAVPNGRNVVHAVQPSNWAWGDPRLSYFPIPYQLVERKRQFCERVIIYRPRIKVRGCILKVELARQYMDMTETSVATSRKRLLEMHEWTNKIKIEC